MAKGSCSKIHTGFAGFFVVLTLGLILMLFNIGFSLGLTFKIPFTTSNFTFAGCIGQKDKAIESLPIYTKGKLAGNKDFINHSMTTTIGPIEGCEIVIIGEQLFAPTIGIHIGIK